jgi:hypothetical protein
VPIAVTASAIAAVCSTIGAHIALARRQGSGTRCTRS